METMDFVELLQWPAMAITVLAAWFMGSIRAKRRIVAFWCFTAGTAIWVVWGLSHAAYGLITLEVIMALMNMRGLKKNLTQSKGEARLSESDVTRPQRPSIFRGAAGPK